MFRGFVISWLFIVVQISAMPGQGTPLRTLDKGDRSQIMSARELQFTVAAAR